MKNRLTLASLMVCLSVASAADDEARHMQDARQLMQRFGSTLKGELQAAMKADGPVAAIKVCNSRAPQIAASLAQESGWRVARTSLKRRNPANAADDWEIATLQDFARRQAAGEDAANLVRKDVVEMNGVKTFRVMKAIATEPACTTCHGVDIKPEVKAELDRLYVGDEARGYQSGDIRGAFTFSKPL